MEKTQLWPSLKLRTGLTLYHMFWPDLHQTPLGFPGVNLASGAFSYLHPQIQKSPPLAAPSPSHRAQDPVYFCFMEVFCLTVGTEREMLGLEREWNYQSSSTRLWQTIEKVVNRCLLTWPGGNSTSLSIVSQRSERIPTGFDKSQRSKRGKEPVRSYPSIDPHTYPLFLHACSQCLLPWWKKKTFSATHR